LQLVAPGDVVLDLRSAAAHGHAHPRLHERATQHAQALEIGRLEPVGLTLGRRQRRAVDERLVGRGRRPIDRRRERRRGAGGCGKRQRGRQRDGGRDDARPGAGKSGHHQSRGGGPRRTARMRARSFSRSLGFASRFFSICSSRSGLSAAFSGWGCFSCLSLSCLSFLFSSCCFSSFLSLSLSFLSLSCLSLSSFLFSSFLSLSCLSLSSFLSSSFFFFSSSSFCLRSAISRFHLDALSSGRRASARL